MSFIIEMTPYIYENDKNDMWLIRLKNPTMNLYAYRYVMIYTDI